jgi:hypothetical protein
VQEKLVEHWLTNVNELSYQIPFCEVLVAKGFDVVHVSTHGRGEHGKDIVARSRSGRLYTFQLKGGDIGLSEWRAIRGEVEELVQLPVRIPGVSETERPTPFLVTNGEIRGDALESIVRYRDEWEAKGAPRLRVISRRTLLRYFLDAQARFLPTGLVDFRRFVELFVADFHERLPRDKFAFLLENILGSAPAKTPTKATRALAGLAVIASYVAEQYERAHNFIAAAEAWTMTASAVVHVAERDQLAPTVYEPVLVLLGVALDRNLDSFVGEAFASRDLGVGRYLLAEPMVYGVRVSLTFGWLSAAAHRARLLDRVEPDAHSARELIKREFSGLRFAGEVDWPTVLLLALYAERILNSNEAEALLSAWIRMILAQNGESGTGVPSPYWNQQRVLELMNGMLAPSELEEFRGHSYTLASALDMMVRRMRRQLMRQVWPQSTELHWCDFQPDNVADVFVWNVATGALRSEAPTLTASWSAWRESSGLLQQAQIPSVLRRHPEWLPVFLMTYPHRANRALSAFAELLLSRRVRFAPTSP